MAYGFSLAFLKGNNVRQQLWISIAVTGNVIFFWKLWIIITQYIQSIDETIKKRCPPLQQQPKKKMTIGIKTSQSIQITKEIKVFRQMLFKFSCIYTRWNEIISSMQSRTKWWSSHSIYSRPYQIWQKLQYIIIVHTHRVSSLFSLFVINISGPGSANHSIHSGI